MGFGAHCGYLGAVERATSSRKGVEGGLYAILSDKLTPIYSIRHHSLIRRHVTCPIYRLLGGCLAGGLLGCREGADALEGAG